MNLVYALHNIMTSWHCLEDLDADLADLNLSLFTAFNCDCIKHTVISA